MPYLLFSNYAFFIIIILKLCLIYYSQIMPYLYSLKLCHIYYSKLCLIYCSQIMIILKLCLIYYSQIMPYQIMPYLLFSNYALFIIPKLCHIYYSQIMPYLPSLVPSYVVLSCEIISYLAGHISAHTKSGSIIL